tara:strand:+ start:313 stop:429 length:117 start_codon:yes stop_codon:yes gene_type:complete
MPPPPRTDIFMKAYDIKKTCSDVPKKNTFSKIKDLMKI